MSWLCPSIPSQLHTLPLNKTIQYEYRKVDPKTKQIMIFVSEDQDGNRSGAYDDCRKIKMESPKVKQLINEFRKNNTHFIDIEFLHHNFSLSSEQFFGEIQWLRVTQIIENAVYAKEQNALDVQNLNINRKAFANALVMVSRCNPPLFKQLISKTLNQQGIYQFKLFRDGYIRNVLVDDYVPVLKGLPMFVGPVRANQVYPMLIEKALAKVCGSYEDIPQDTQQILQMLLCGPVNRFLLSDLRKQGKLVQKIQESIIKKQIVILVSKQENKIRNYGLNQDQIYQVVNKYEINWEGQYLKELQESKILLSNQSNLLKNSTFPSQFGKIKMEQSLVRSKLGQSSKLNQTNSLSQIQTVFECISENKISAWNGRYSLNDAVWQKVSIDKKMQIYKQLNKNRSFVISQVDIAKYFQQLLILQPAQINSKDWIQNQSQNSFLSFSRFQVTQQDSIFIRVTSRSQLKQTLILAKEIGHKKYQFVQSAFTANSKTLQLRTEVKPGKYIVGVMHEWFVNKSGMYYIFLESKTHTYLQKGGVNDKDFLLKVLFNKEEVKNSNKQVKQECTIHLQLSKLGLSYIILRPENTKSKTLCMLIDQISLKKDNWQVLQPYNGLSEVIVTEKSDQTSKIIVLSKIDLDLKKKNYFPTTAFVIKK